MGGYVLLFQYLASQGIIFKNYELNRDLYSSPKPIEIKIPTHTPYIQEQKGFDLEPGQMEFRGRNYDNVSVKVTLDTLYLKYTDHYQEPQLSNGRLIKDIGDATNQKKNHSQLEKKSDIDNEYNFSILIFNQNLNELTLIRSFAYTTPKLINNCLSAPGQPPEQA